MGCYMVMGGGIFGKVLLFVNLFGYFMYVLVGCEYVMCVFGVLNLVLLDWELVDVLNWVFMMMNCDVLLCDFKFYMVVEVVVYCCFVLFDVVIECVGFVCVL